MWRELNEPIDAFVIYRRGAPRPDLRAFRWQDRRYDVSTTEFVHTERSGEAVSLCYSVRCGTEQFAVRFDTAKHRWLLEAIDVAS
jgi:hypothetical protein